ncbi:MAG: tetratricopeptide repeat protein [Bacteroidales bacterium]
MHTFLKLSLSITAIAVCYTSSANDNKKGIEFYNAGLLNTAKSILKDNIQKGDVNQAEACYYLGEIYYDSNSPDSASYYYKEGIKANPLYAFNLIGDAKLTLKSNPVEAGKVISTILKAKTARKDPALWIAAAKAYFTSGASKEKALEYLEKAKTIDPKYAETYVLEGDIYSAAKNYGNASSSYEQAIYFDPNCYHAYLKSSRIYSNLNIQSSIDMMKRLLEVYPKSPIAEKELAELYYKNGQLLKAKEVYAEHIKSGYATNADKARYANLIYFAEDYGQSLSIVKEVLAVEPDNIVMKRLLMYNLLKLQDYIQGIVAAKDFMKSAKPEDFISSDYVNYGQLLSENNEYKASITAFETALKMDSSRVDLFREIGYSYEKLNDYANAIINYKSYVDKLGGQVTAKDYFDLGKVYYFAGNTLDTTAVNNDARIKYYQEADSLFQRVANLAPDNYLGTFWQGRINALIDPTSEKGLAKPYYEAATTLLEKDNSSPQLLIECYRYLGYFHYLKDDFEQSKIYWNKILAIEPTNELALTALKGMK